MKFKSFSNSFVLKHLSQLLYASLIIMAFTVVLIFYYSTPLRSQIEAKFYDIKITTKPSNKLQNTKIIDLKASYLNAARNHNDIKKLRDLIDTLLKYEPRAIALVLPPNILEKNIPLNLRKQYKQKYPRKIYFGSFRKFLNQNSEHLQNVKESKDQFFENAETLRHFRRQVVRSLPYYIFQGGSPAPHLTFRIAKDHAPHNLFQLIKKHSEKSLNDYMDSNSNEASFLQDAFSIDGPSYLINYSNPQYLNKINIDLLDPNNVDQLNLSILKNQIVVVGTTQFFPKGKNSMEGSYVNTPWQNDSLRVTKRESIPIHHILALGIDNLMTNNHIIEAPLFLSISQTIVLSVISILTWFFLSPSLAILSFISLIFLALSVQIFLLSVFQIFLPFADSLVYALLANTIGAFRYTHWASRLRELQRLNLMAKQEIDKVQGKFLDQFSSSLAQMNKKLVKQTQPILADNITETAKSLVGRLHVNANEFDEYLSGIQQVANLNKCHQPTKKKVSLWSLINETVNQLDLGMQGYDKRICIEGHVDAQIYSDPLFLKPILYNFITNALKYSNKNVVISVEIIDYRHIRVKVIDFGPGIPKEMQHRIFEKFYRIRNESLYQVKGNGLGLYLSRFFAEKLDAKVGLVSEQNEGSTFYIDLERYRD